MSTLSQEEKNEMTLEQQFEYCRWCFYRDFGNCKACALNAVTMPCDKCGQLLSDNGVGGEYPCELCGIPTVHDEVSADVVDYDARS